MKAAVFEQFRGPITVREVPQPVIRPDAALIELAACGICRSDWHGWMGHDSDVQLPHVPGHELAGTVAAVGSEVRKWQPGSRVTVPFCCGCGTCPQCTIGHTHICDNYTQPGFTQWGAFAQFVEIRHADVNLVQLPDSVDFVTAASLGCRFATSFHAVVNQAKATADDTVAVFGCGGVGLSAVMIAAALDARVLAIDIHDDQLQKATACGASDTFNSASCDNVPAAIRSLTDGGATVSIDALGSRQTCYESIQSLRKKGRQVQIGLMLGDDRDPPIPMASVIAAELQILGSHGMAVKDYPKMLDWITAGRLRPQQLIGRTVSLQDAGQVLSELNRFATAGAVVIDQF